MKTLVLDYNLKYMYAFFDDLIAHLDELKKNDADKRSIEQCIQAAPARRTDVLFRPGGRAYL